ncbi:MAG TPA: hypothetical protein VH560_17700, partial [Polyangia bacterium]|nr:hypothetical protein [Polyangia bacterium]
MRLELPPAPRAHGLVVGQAVPVTIRAFFRGGTGVSLNGVPRVSSDGFTLADLTDKPRQTETLIQGTPYTELTWSGVLTAVKAGATDPTIELPTSLSYVDASPNKALDAPNDDGADTLDPSGTFSKMLAQSPFASDPFFAQM